MRRPTSSTSQRTTSVRARRVPIVAGMWSSLIRPAIMIGIVGACAVLYLVACARLSVIECDLRRLDRVAEDEEARELDLHRHLAELRNAERIRAHIADRGLCPPVAVAHVVLEDVPPALQPALPTPERDLRTREMRLGQLPPGATGPLHASARPSD